MEFELEDDPRIVADVGIKFNIQYKQYIWKMHTKNDFLISDIKEYWIRIKINEHNLVLSGS